MAAPRFAPTPALDDSRSYGSLNHVPEGWTQSRAVEIVGRQPAGERLGYQGPDQGYILTLARRMRPQVHVTSGESIDDAMRGCTLIALRRASLYGRGPAIDDLRLALTIWGYLDASAPAELVAARKVLFEGVHNAAHHYAEGRAIADMVPEATLRMTVAQVSLAMPTAWRTLTGA